MSLNKRLRRLEQYRRPKVSMEPIFIDFVDPASMKAAAILKVMTGTAANPGRRIWIKENEYR